MSVNDTTMSAGRQLDSVFAFLGRLAGVRQCQGYWMARCPAHDDHDPSLSVKESRDKILVRCHAGCSAAAVVDALGLPMSALTLASAPSMARPVHASPSREGDGARALVATYDYVDAQGVIRHQTLRYAPKRFRQRHAAPDGSWVWSLQGVETILYRLPEVLASERVYLCEGEKDADALAALGVCATTAPMGAGKWQPQYTAALQGKTVVLLPDNDQAGRQHMARVGTALAGAAIRHAALPLPHLPEKGDVSDWLTGGGTREELEILADEALARATPAPTKQQASNPFLRTRSYNDLVETDFPPPMRLFDGLMHEGMLLLGGKSKRGKSWLMLDIALSLACGIHALRHFRCEAPRPVLYIALEDGARRIKERGQLIQPALRTTKKPLDFLHESPTLSPQSIANLREVILQKGYALVVIDVLTLVEPKGKNGEKGYHEAYEMFSPLQDLRREHPFCLAMLTHLRKSDADDVFDALHGSVAYQGAQDALWVLERKPKDDYAFLHVRDKDDGDHEYALHFTEGHWEYIGEGEEHKGTQQQRKVIRVLHEEGHALSIRDLMRACGVDEAQYEQFRKMLIRLAKDDLIHRTDRGLYAASIRSTHEYPYADDADIEARF